MLRSFTRPLAELTSTCLPSKSHHTGVTCGCPSGIRVPRLANAFFLNRSRYFSRIAAGIRTLLWQSICHSHGELKRILLEARRRVIQESVDRTNAEVQALIERYRQTRVSDARIRAGIVERRSEGHLFH